MRKRFFLLAALIMGLSGVFVANGIYAGTQVPDVIPMNDKAYKKHKYAINQFKHKKHYEAYAQKNPKLYKLGCGECHHDKDNKPLTSLKAGDTVQKCIECHTKASLKPSKVKLKKKEKIKQYHGEAVHANCQVCHKKFNKAKKLKSKNKASAPTKSKCKRCHVK